MGHYVEFLMLVPFMYDPIGRLHQLNQLFQAGRAAGERVFEIMDEEPEPGDAGGGESEAGHGAGRGRVSQCFLRL